MCCAALCCAVLIWSELVCSGPSPAMLLLLLLLTAEPLMLLVSDQRALGSRSPFPSVDLDSVVR